MSDQPQDIESIFALALQKNAEQRAAYLDEICDGNPSLREQVESLLQAEHGMGDFLDQTQSQLESPSPRKRDAKPSGNRGDSDLSSPSSHHGRFLPGAVIGSRYRVVSLVGRGGMGEVYRADDMKLGQTVALKFLPEDFANDSQRLAYFHKEVSLTRLVSHPNVCRVFDIGEIDGQHYLSMEYIDGEDLRGLLRRIGRLPMDKGVEIAQQLCSGLAAAHACGVLHRDLKPANIMLDGQGQVRITDFGLARASSDGEPKEIAGTPAYMAPEQLLSGETSEQSDLYAIGLILAEVFFGKQINDGARFAELVQKYRTDDESLDSLGSVDVDPVVEVAIRRCLERLPEDRPHSARQLKNLLPGGDPLEAAIAAGTTPSPDVVANSRDRSRLKMPIALTLLCIVVVTAVLNAWQSQVTRVPESSPQELSVRCESILRELGYAKLPENYVSGLDANGRMMHQLLTEHHAAEWLDEQPFPPYQYWRRWTDGAVMVDDFHMAYLSNVDSPLVDNDQEFTTVVDPVGNLLALKVLVEDRSEERIGQSQPDWTSFLQLAGIESDALSDVAIAKTPSVHCDQLKAWLVEKGSAKERTIQAGSLLGRINYFEVIGLDQAMSYSSENEDAPPIIAILFAVLFILVFVAAWYNVRASRSDLKRAMSLTLFVGALYLVQEISALNIRSPDFQHALMGLLHGRAFGHILAHAMFVGAGYLAIEPFVRRFWPRSLVGLTRVSDGRFRDPIVGKELLVGVTVACVLYLAGALVFKVMGLFGYASDTLIIVNTRFLISTSSWFSGQLNLLSGGMLQAFMIASLCVLLRVFSSPQKFPKHLAISVAMILVCIAVPKLMKDSKVSKQAPQQHELESGEVVDLMGNNADEESRGFIWYMPFFAMTTVLVMSNVFFRVGLLATYVAFVSMYLLMSAPPLSVESWFFEVAAIAAAAPVLLAIFGFIASQGSIAELVRRMDVSDRVA